MSFRTIFTYSFLLKSVFVLSLFILVFISSISYKHSIALKESTELLTHSYKIQVKLEQLISYLKDAETGQRGFIISGDSTFLEPYNSAREKVKEPFMSLKMLTALNLKQQNNLDSLRNLMSTRFSLLAISLDLASEPELNKKLLRENLIKGKQVMDQIRAHINKMVDLETIYFNEHQKKYAHEIFFTPIFTLFLLLFPLLVFTISYIKINRDLNILKKTNEDLLITTEAFKHAEEIGNFSSWQWDLDSNKLHYSDNQYRLLGCEPQSFEPNIGNMLEFIHPGDKHIITEGTERALTERKSSIAYFRVIRKDSELRYFKSASKLMNYQGNTILIGINSDITEQHLNNVALEERNRELEQSNKELASFNHIASHDLQEPLRKIETFISRLLDKELPTLSVTGKEYVMKIQSSVISMRRLIDDLLLFSRTTKTEKIFEKTDLNRLLENANQELAQDIEEKNAVINSAPLPVLNVIPYQIQQLFINLIGNSLKYSKPGITPVIKIDCEKVNAKDYPLLKDNSHKTFYKISITDNGLGFEQQYAENIFVLFYRLYHKTEYPGSGIGLSICKKIVEGHNGFITAEGKPGIGSTFTFYLPA